MEAYQQAAKTLICEERNFAPLNSAVARSSVFRVNRLILAIARASIDHFDENREYSDLLRLKEEAARNFYAMLLECKLNKYSVKQTIRLTLSYWKKLVEICGNDYVFVGRWGDGW